jgi:hypothetical protein
MKFSEIIDGLKEGHIYQCNEWDGNKVIMMQIPAVIPADVVPKMTSVQPALKQYLSTVGSGAISYHDQVLIVNMVDDASVDAQATYYIPTWEDIFADDWRVM